ncbi:ABC transporter ATP-binding protein [Rhodosalinus sp. 5P4]|uniref:FliH/SctL family protein n=1 Tax=Rhodosalinus sp. 5P4 TaxID=3239196 RepID=UPI00352694DA
MSIAHLLEDFALARPQPTAAQSSPLSDEQLEALRLEAFEEGYKAGWDDAVAARDKEETRLSAELAGALQDLSFTYNEAYAHMVKAIEPLLERMVGSLLPSLMREALGAHVLSELGTLTRELGQAEVEVHVPPGQVDTIGTLVEGAGFPARVIGDPALGEGQAQLRFGTSERQVDLDDILSEIRRAISAFCHETERELRHG